MSRIGSIYMFAITFLMIVSSCHNNGIPEDSFAGKESVLKTPVNNASDLVPNEVVFTWEHPGGTNISFDLLISADNGNKWDLVNVGYGTSYKPPDGSIRGSTSYLWMLITRKGEQYLKSSKYSFSTVKQFATNDYETYFSNGNGKVNLVILGDGFIKEDLLEKGSYQQMAQKLIDFIFSIEPYKTYKNYFNTYISYTESRDRGILRGDGPAIGNATHQHDSVSTYFESSYDSYGLNTLKDKCYQTVELIPGVDADKAMICLVLNDTKYGGMTWMNSSGRAIPICPMSVSKEPFSFYNLVLHETGHAFPKLADEYGGNSTPASDQVKNEILNWQGIGWFLNVSVNNDSSALPWKSLMGLTRYSKSAYSPVGIYEGGYSYWYGIYRPEAENCMRGAMITYYDVSSREMIVKRILNIVEEEFTTDKFLANDKIVPATQIQPKKSISPGNIQEFPHYKPVIIDNTGVLSKSF
jgi:hypothetical protein